MSRKPRTWPPRSFWLVEHRTAGTRSWWLAFGSPSRNKATTTAKRIAQHFPEGGTRLVRARLGQALEVVP